MNINITQNLWAAKEWARVSASGNPYVALVHEATNEEKWGPTGPQMENICRNYGRGGADIMEELRWKMKSRDKAWRPCYKSLLVIDYLARNVNDKHLPEICSLVSTLRNIAQSFYYTNPKGVDHGVSVRERAKNLADLLSDGLLLREERAKASATKAKLAKNASDGGGPGAYSNTGNRYGGYGGNSGSGGAARSGGGGYDPYPAQRRRDPTPPVARTKEEQERFDMEMALRMQREEERRAGVSAEQLENMYAKKVQKRQERDQEQKRYAVDADEELARRLQQEEEQRALREGRSLPALRSDSSPEPTPVTLAANPPSAPPPPEPKKDVLDDLFAPAPVAPPQQVQQGGGAGCADPFDAFLDNRAQQQQQQQHPWGGGQPQPLQSSNPWDQQPQQNQWAAPPPPPQPPQPPQPQSSGGNDGWGQPQSVGGNQWGSAAPQPQPQPQPPQQQFSDPWNQPQRHQQQQHQPWDQPANNFNNNFGDNNHNYDGSNRFSNGAPQQPPQQQQQPQSDPWGNFSNPPTASNTAAQTSDDPMWAAFGQFTQQQQRKH